jgi:aromatic ring hydroxylase
VPWERVFVYRDTDMCRAQFHDDDAAIAVDQRAAGIAGVERRVGLDDAIDQPPGGAAQAAAER